MVPKTRPFYHFNTYGVALLKFKRITNDKSFCGEHNFLSSRNGLFFASDHPTLSYICCTYDSQWWIRMIL